MLISQLEYFSVVAKHQHISRAAEELNIAQPAISTMMKKLEQELGVPLFEKVGRNIVLTEAGEQLQLHAAYILDQLSAMEQSLEETRELLENKVTIAVSNSLFLCEWLQRFVMEYPKIRFNQRLMNETQMLNALMDESIDLAIGEFDRDMEGIERRLIVKDNYMFTIHKTHPLASKEKIVFEDLRNEDIIALPSNATYPIALRVFARQNCVPKIVFEGNLTLTANLVLAGKGVLFTSRQLVYMATLEHKSMEKPFPPEVVNYTIADMDCSSMLCVCWKKDRELSVMAQKVIESLEKSYPRYYDDDAFMKESCLELEMEERI